MKNRRLLLLVGISLLALAGCEHPGLVRIKSLESREAAMTPNPKASGKTVDPYTYGGAPEAAGGQKAGDAYATSLPTAH